MRRRLLQLRSKNNGPKASREVSAFSPSAEPAAAVAQGLQVVADGINPIIDIVAVHGLNGHYEKTWTTSDGVNWLRHLLPHDIPSARILSWGYDANTHSRSRVSCQYLFDHARTLVSDLCLERQITQTTRRPIIFVAHSLGGIIVKSALIHSEAARRGALEEHRSIKLSTYGVMFMGTPHQGGSSVALGRLIVNVASVFMTADDRLLQHLERDSEWLQQQLGQYGPISGEFVTKFVFEEYPTPIALGKSIMVVPRASAVVPGATDGEPIAIHADHINMVKFGSKSDPGYKTVSGHLRLMTGKAVDAIGSRWDTEGRVDAVRSNQFIQSFTIPSSVIKVLHVEHFVGRDEEIHKIHKEFQNNSFRRTVVVHGLGGMGKTQLALAYTHRHRDKYSAVFWVNSKDVDTLKQGYMAAARRIYREHLSLLHVKTAVDENDLDEAVETVKQWLSRSQNGQWLIIYDNYDTPKLPGCNDVGTFDIRPFLPEAEHGAVLITTRSSQLSLGHTVAVKKLQSIEQSLEILSHTSGRDGLSSDSDARKLVRELDGLPLALATAGAYLHHVSTSFADYFRMYDASWLQLQQATPQLLSYEDRALYSTWGISFNHVKQQSELAAKLLQLWAYFDNQDVWFELLQECQQGSLEWFSELTQEQLSFDKAIRVLCDYALVEADASLGDKRVESQGYSMHSCVHSWTVHVLNQEWDTEMAGLAFECVGRHLPNTNQSDSLVTKRRLMRHAARSWGFILDGSMDSGGKEEHLHSFGVVFEYQGRLNEAEKMLQCALRGKEKAWGPDHISTLEVINDLGNVYAKLGRLDEAEKMFQRALQGNEKALGLDHVSTFDTVNNLGNVYAGLGRLDEAEKMYQRALHGKEKVLGLEHTSTLNTVNNLGILFDMSGRLNEAENMYQRALQGKEKALGLEHTSTLNTVNNLGILYAKLGRLEEAEKMYKRALSGFQKHFGFEHEQCRELRHALATL